MQQMSSLWSPANTPASWAEETYGCFKPTKFEVLCYAAVTTDTGVGGSYDYLLSRHFAKYFAGMNSFNSYNRKVNTTAGLPLKMETLGVTGTK